MKDRSNQQETKLKDWRNQLYRSLSGHSPRPEAKPESARPGHATPQARGHRAEARDAEFGVVVGEARPRERERVAHSKVTGRMRYKLIGNVDWATKIPVTEAGSSEYSRSEGRKGSSQRQSKVQEHLCVVVT